MTSKPTDGATRGTFLARLRDEPGAAVQPQAGLKPCDARRRDHLPGRVTRVYGQDTSETVEYRFDSSGYRGEEYRSDAKVRICVIGESHAFGTGVHFEETFGFRLKAMLAKVMGLNLHDVNLLNFSFGGASADYCARTLHRQLPQVSVDFVVCVVPPMDRIEFKNGKIYNSLVVGSVDVTQLEKLPSHLLGYCEYYSHEVGRLNRVKNLLLMQGLLRSLDIEYVFAVENMPTAGDGFDAIDPYLSALDEERVMRHRFFLPKFDRAADGDHAGPRTHGAFAIQLFHHFGWLLRSRQMIDLADRIEAQASRLMAEDADYLFCKHAS